MRRVNKIKNSRTIVITDPVDIIINLIICVEFVICSGRFVSLFSGTTSDKNINKNDTYDTLIMNNI